VEVPKGGQRIFEIHVNASSLGVEEGGWTLLIREVTELRRVQDKANQQDRLAAVGQLASGIAHDFNNIMGAILLYSEMILDRVEMGEKDRGRMRTIMDQAQRAASLTRQILDFSSGGLMEPHLFDLAPFVEEMRALLERTLPENIRIIVDEKGEGYIVNADPVQLRQVFMNLALNARDAMEGGGELRIRLRKRRFGEGNPPPSREMGAGEWLCVTVADTGSGIPANLLPHVFEPFFTTKEPGEGSGLGLPQVYGIVKQHGGSVEIESEIGQGTSVHVYLPARAGTVQTDLIVEEEPVNQPVKGTVVVVEDDPPTRRAIGDVLQMEGYRVLLASDGSEAIEQLERHNGRIDMVVSDLVMPGIGGMALLRQLGKDYPEVKVMLMTGHPLGPATRKLLQERGVRWLAKPVRSESLLAAVAGALSNGNPTRA
jgi:signal transduction histidine kinase/CheY-like chemotaxis protein